MLAGGSANGTIYLWDPETGEVLHTLPEHIVSAVSFSVPTDLYLQVAVEITLYVCGTLRQANS